MKFQKAACLQIIVSMINAIAIEFTNAALLAHSQLTYDFKNNIDLLLQIMFTAPKLHTHGSSDMDFR